MSGKRNNLFDALQQLYQLLLGSSKVDWRQNRYFIQQPCMGNTFSWMSSSPHSKCETLVFSKIFFEIFSNVWSSLDFLARLPGLRKRTGNCKTYIYVYGLSVTFRNQNKNPFPLLPLCQSVMFLLIVEYFDKTDYNRWYKWHGRMQTVGFQTKKTMFYYKNIRM